MNTRRPEDTPVGLVLSGGNALGAFQAGACAALHEAGVHPVWIVGCSVGAVNGALLAGGPDERRIERLRRFWDAAAQPTAALPAAADIWADPALRRTAQMRTALFGRPSVFVPGMPDLASAGLGAWDQAGVYDLAPLRGTLEDLIDFDRLNDPAAPRLTIRAVDVETGEEVLFDNRRTRIGPDHVMASAALLPDFRPIEIDGRLLADGGFLGNLPLDIVLRDPRAGRLRCFAIDLFSRANARPASLSAALERRLELLFVSQTGLMLEANRREDHLRRLLGALLELVPEDRRHTPQVAEAAKEAGRAGIEMVRLVCPPEIERLDLRNYDFSDRAIAARWDAGETAVRESLDREGTAART